ncbi:rCG28093 [Rattus norvegicus]|uniref:RCG28093 n=1 Tax=Rattus norvegicus TaxID=10116 RepID=A6IDX3_RAT|nr:rCG28093 [Rattus norvegicus]
MSMGSILNSAFSSRTDVNECFWRRQDIEGRRRRRLEVPQLLGTIQDEVGETDANRFLYFLGPARDRLLRETERRHLAL